LVSTLLPIGISKLTQSGDRILEYTTAGPDVLEKNGLRNILETSGCILSESKTADLSAEEASQYGAWLRLGFASRHLADIVANQIQRGLFVIGLLPNCNGAIGMLAGFQRANQNSNPLRVGMIWLDAHGDINTPETTVSGLLAGMPVAIASGLCLERLRKACGLETALPTKNITMVGVRDVDLLEKEILEKSDIENITSDDIRTLSSTITQQMERLEKITDTIYVHIDIDVLDPKDIPGHGLPAEGGPNVSQLGAAFEIIFRYPKVKGMGIAGYPVGRDPDQITLKSVYALIEHAIEGVTTRNV